MATRAKAKFADYILYYKPNLPLAILKAKDNNHTVGACMQQGLGYAEMVDAPFVFSSNGDAFLMHDRTGQGNAVERELALDDFPSSGSGRSGSVSAATEFAWWARGHMPGSWARESSNPLAI